MKFRKTLILLMSLFMFLISSFSVYALDYIEKMEPVNVNNFRDIKGHWSEDAMKNIIKHGIMNGTSATTASPDNKITRGEMCALMVRAFEPIETADLKQFVDVNDEQWFYPYVAKAFAMGIVTGNGNSMNPNGNITREDAAVIFYRAFNLNGYKGNLSGFVDLDKVSGYAMDAISACVGANIINGNAGMLNPKAELTRAEFTSMLNRAANVYVNSLVPYEHKNVEGSMVISTPNVSVNSITISGNLYIADGVGDGSITIDNVSVNGKVYIRGGKNIYIRNNSKITGLVICNGADSLMIESDVTCSVDSTIFESEATSIKMKGSFGAISFNNSKDTTVDFDAVDVRTLNVNAPIKSMLIDEDSKIRNFNVMPNASKVSIKLEGDSDNLIIQAEEANIEIKEGTIIDTVNIQGKNNKVTSNGEIKNIVLNGQKNHLKLESKAVIKNYDFVGTEFTLEIQSDVDTDNLEFNTPKVTKTMSIIGDEFTLGSKSDGSKFTFDSSTNLKELIVDGDSVTLTLNKGARINLITVNGNHFHIKGKGDVNKIVFTKDVVGGNVEITGVDVVNNSNNDITAGEGTIPRKSEGKIDDDGEVTYKDKNGNTINTSNGDTGNNSNSGNNSGTSNTDRSSDLQLSYAANVIPADLESSGKYNIRDFSLGLSYSDSMRKLTGTVKLVENFNLIGENNRTGYYVPMILTSTDKVDSFTLVAGGRTYTKSDMRNLSSYGNSLLFYIALDPNNLEKTVDVVFDADGNDSAYSATTAKIDYKDVKFDGDVDLSTRIQLLKGAPNYNSNGESLQVSGVKNSGNNNFTVNLKATSLGKSTNPLGVEAYWGGVKIYAPKDTVSAVIKQDGYDVSRSDLVTETIDGTFYKYLTFYYDMETTSKVVLDIEWKNVGNTTLENIEHYILDFSFVNRDNGSGAVTKPSDGTGDIPICLAVNVSSYADSVLFEDLGMHTDDFASEYSIIDAQDLTLVRGIYNKVNFDGTPSEGARPVGYYAPMLVTLMDIKDDCRLYVGNTLLKNIKISDGDAQAIYLLVPLDYIDYNVKDFVLSIKPLKTEQYANSDKKVDCTGASVNESEIIIKLASKDSASFNYSSMVDSSSDLELVNSAMGYRVAGKLKYTNQLLGYGSYVNGYFVPVTLNQVLAANTFTEINVKIHYKYSSEVNEYNYFMQAGETSIDLAIPVARLDMELNEETEKYVDVVNKYDSVSITIVQNEKTVALIDFDLNSSNLIFEIPDRKFTEVEEKN